MTASEYAPEFTALTRIADAFTDLVDDLTGDGAHPIGPTVATGSRTRTHGDDVTHRLDDLHLATGGRSSPRRPPTAPCASPDDHRSAQVRRDATTRERRRRAVDRAAGSRSRSGLSDS